jgi:glycosyltransferase involved in cell wall biosynthesis
LNVLGCCEFKGKIADHKELENEIAKSCVAIAPYIKSLDSWTYYADPGKVKTYLACGVPVLLTDVPWNTKEIVENKCGMIIKEDEKDITGKIVYFMDKEINQQFRDNAIKYSLNFDYKKIFEGLIQ